MYRLIFFISFFFLASNGFAQDTLTSKTVEERTYQLYQQKNWSELIHFGNKAIEKGFDYYYLRMRIGTAYYERKNYRSAQAHFRKALSFNTADEVATEYLYYCYVFNAQYDHAKKFTRKFSDDLSKKLGTDKSSSIDFMMLEGGTKTTTMSGLSNAYYGQYGLGHHLGKNVSFFHAITWFDQKGDAQDLDQKQYYISVNIPVKNSWSISPAFHILNTTKSYQNSWVQIDTLWPMGIHIIPPPGAPPLQIRKTPHSSTSLVRSNYFIGSMEIKKSISKFDIGLCGTISNIDSINQTQGNLYVSYFPLGNTKLSFTSIGYVQRESIVPSNRYVFAQSVSLMLFPKINLTGSYLYNEAYHFNEMNGYIANNSNDLTTSRITLMSTVYLSRHVNFYLLYQLENKEQGNPKNKTSTYTYNNFFGGLKFIL